MKNRFIALTAICTLFFAACGNNLEKTVDNFYKATKDSDFEKAMTYTNVLPEERQQVIDVLSEMGMVIHEYKILGSTVDEGDTTATVKLHLVTSNAYNPNKIADDIDVPCIKSGSNWVVELQPANN